MTLNNSETSKVAEKKSALICIDFIQDLVHPDGKVAAHGNADFIKRHRSLENAEQLQAWARQAHVPIIHVRVGFSEQHNPAPQASPLFGPAKKNGVFVSNSWGTRFMPALAPIGGERSIEKPRVNAFYRTELEELLVSKNISHLIFCGCATDLAVQSAARDAHDRDFNVTVIGDCCVAKSDEVQRSTLEQLKRVADVTSLKTFLSTNE